MRNSHQLALAEDSENKNWNKVVMTNLARINPGFKDVSIDTEKTLHNHRKKITSVPTSSEKNTIEWFSSLPSSYPEDITQQYSKFHISSKDKRVMQKFVEEEYNYLRVISEVMMKDIMQAYLKTLDWNIRVFNTTPYDDTFKRVDAIIETTDISGTHYSWVDVCISDKSWLTAKKLWLNNDEFWYNDSQQDEQSVWINYNSENTTVAQGSEFEKKTGYTEVMPRVVKDFNPQIIAFIFEKYLKDIQQGIDPSLAVWDNYQKTKADVANKKGHSSVLTEVPMTELASQVMWMIDSESVQIKKAPTLATSIAEARKEPKIRTQKILTLKKKNGK